MKNLVLRSFTVRLYDKRDSQKSSMEDCKISIADTESEAQAEIKKHYDNLGYCVTDLWQDETIEMEQVEFISLFCDLRDGKIKINNSFRQF